MRSFSRELHFMTILEVSEVVGTDAQLSLASSTPTIHIQCLRQCDIMTGAASDVDNNMIDKAFHESWVNGDAAFDLLALPAIAEVLSPLVHSALFCEAKSMISTTFNFGNVQPLSEERWTCYELCS